MNFMKNNGAQAVVAEGATKAREKSRWQIFGQTYRNLKKVI